MTRTKVGGLIECPGMCLVEIRGYVEQKNEPCVILCELGQRDISLHYVSIGDSETGDRNMALCIDRHQCGDQKELMELLELEVAPKDIRIRKNAMTMTLYGPHFKERPNLIGELYSTFKKAQIDVWSVCSSVNSISFVIDEGTAPTARSVLRATFEWPS